MKTQMTKSEQILHDALCVVIGDLATLEGAGVAPSRACSQRLIGFIESAVNEAAEERMKEQTKNDPNTVNQNTCEHHKYPRAASDYCSNCGVRVVEGKALRVADIPPVLTRGRKNEWCKCGKGECVSEGVMMEDGACACGCFKHHVHCATCGAICQIG